MGDYMICQTEVANDYFLISNLGQMKVLHLQEDGLLPAADGWGATFHTASYVDPLLPEKIFLYNGKGEDFFFHSAEGTFTSLDLPVVKNKETQRVVLAYQDGDSVLLAVGDSVAGKGLLLYYACGRNGNIRCPAGADRKRRNPFLYRRRASGNYLR